MNIELLLTWFITVAFFIKRSSDLIFFLFIVALASLSKLSIYVSTISDLLIIYLPRIGFKRSRLTSANIFLLVLFERINWNSSKPVFSMIVWLASSLTRILLGSLRELNKLFTNLGVEVRRLLLLGEVPNLVVLLIAGEVGCSV